MKRNLLSSSVIFRCSSGFFLCSVHFRIRWHLIASIGFRIVLTAIWKSIRWKQSWFMLMFIRSWLHQPWSWLSNSTSILDMGILEIRFWGIQRQIEGNRHSCSANSIYFNNLICRVVVDIFVERFSIRRIFLCNRNSIKIQHKFNTNSNFNA